jgi:hypothetical protein
VFSEVRTGKQLASKRKDHSFVGCANPSRGVCCNRYVGKGAWEKRWEVKNLGESRTGKSDPYGYASDFERIRSSADRAASRPHRDEAALQAERALPALPPLLTNRVAYLKQALRGLSGGFRWRRGAGKRTALFRRRWRCRHLNFQLLPADSAGVLVFGGPDPSSSCPYSRTS